MIWSCLQTKAVIELIHKQNDVVSPFTLFVCKLARAVILASCSSECSAIIFGPPVPQNEYFIILCQINYPPQNLGPPFIELLCWKKDHTRNGYRQQNGSLQHLVIQWYNGFDKYSDKMVLPHMSRLTDYSIRGQYTLAGLKCWLHVAT